MIRNSIQHDSSRDKFFNHCQVELLAIVRNSKCLKVVDEKVVALPNGANVRFVQTKTYPF